MKAIVSNHNIAARVVNMSLGTSLGRGAEIIDVPIPSITPNEILVKVTAVALNPTDYKHIDVISPSGSIIGCDFAGEVTKVGAAWTEKWNVGDRVAGAVHGGLYPDRGSFAEYLKADGDLVFKIPRDMDDTNAAVYGVSASTAMLALNKSLELPWPSTEHSARMTNNTLLVYAGSTSAGLFCIQVAKASGWTVVTTASPRSFDLVRRYGADAVYDYSSKTLASDILSSYPHISSAVDCISEGKSTGICAEVLAKNGGKVVTLLNRGESKTEGVTYELVLLYTVYGKAFQWLPPMGPKFEATPEHREWYARFCDKLPGLTGPLRPIPVTLSEGGLEAVFEGLEKLRGGKVSGGKLVVKF